MFTSLDAGRYADSALGHTRVRHTLASLLYRTFRHHPCGGDGICWPKVQPVWDSLHRDMPDDAWDEEQALNLLNSHAVGWDCRFEVVDGDLLLVGTSEESDYHR